MSSEPAVFVLADRALERVIAQIDDDQWNLELPDWFQLASSHRGTGMTVRDIVNYLAYDDAWVPDMLAFRTMNEVGSTTFQGDLLGSDPLAGFRRYADLACAAAEAFPVANLDQMVHLSFGEFTAQHYFWQINQFRAFRAVDLARLIDGEAMLPTTLVQGIWDEVYPHVEAWREIGVYPAAVMVPEDAPLIDRLLGMSGRDPSAYAVSVETHGLA